MNVEEAKRRGKGPVVPVLTILKDELSLDLDGLRTNVQYLLKAGATSGAAGCPRAGRLALVLTVAPEREQATRVGRTEETGRTEREQEVRQRMPTQRLVLLAMLLPLVSAATGAAALDPLGPEATTRVPAARVPMGKAPALDGRIVKGDYGPATLLQDLVVVAGEDRGVAGRYPTKVILTYNQRALYVGFRTEMPEGARPKVTVREGHDTGFSDDGFEIFLTVGDSDGEQFHLGGNAAGVTWERALSKADLDWKSWNPKIRYAAYVEEGSWGGEFEIPWTELAVECPKVGDVWRANFYANRQTPDRQLESWSYVNKWRDSASNGRLIFGSGDLPYFSFWGSWKDAWQTHTRGLFLPVQTPKGAADPRKVQVTMQLWRRDLDPTHEGSFYTEFEDRRKEATKEGGTMATFQQDLADVLKTFKPVEDYQFVKNLPDPDFTVGWGPTYRVNQGGDYLVRYYLKDITDPGNPTLLAGGVLPFRIRTGVQASVTPYLLTRQSVVVTADLRAIPDLAAIGQLRAFVTEDSNDKPLSETTASCAGEPKQDLEVSVKGLPVDRQYRAHLQVFDRAGKATSAAWAPFARPAAPDWWVNRNRYGSQPEVPQPWKPLRVRNGEFGARTVVECWGRKIAFGDSVLPRQITNQGKEILAAPVHLELTTVGKLQTWSKESLRITETRPGHVRLESLQEASGLRIRGVNVSEFDGFSLIALDLEPITEQALIDNLDLVIPVKSEYASFLTNYHYAPGPGPKMDMFGQKRYVGKTPDHYHSPVMLTTWLGTDDMGLEWSAESSKGWSLTSPEKAIEVDRKGKVVEVRLHFFDHRMTLDKPRQIHFGLIATPTKSVPPERYNWHIDFASGPPPIPGKTKVERAQYDSTLVVATQEHLDTYWKDRAPVDINVALLPGDWSGCMVWHARVADPERAAIIREQERMLKEHGKWVLRNGGWAVAPYAAEWDPWGKEMVALPQVPTFANQLNHSYASPFVEFFVGSWTMHARELGVRGIRFDTVFPWSESANPWLGETWQADDGKTYGTQSLFRQREMVKKLYRSFNGGEVKAGIIYHPLAGPPIMAVESFVDIHEVGEGYYMHADSLKKGYIQDAVRVWMTGKPYGFVAVNNIKGGPLTPNHRIGALLAAGATPRIMLRPQVDIRTYETRDSYMPTSALWNAWSWVDRAAAQWHPHWTNSDKVSTGAAGEHYVSFHLQPGRRILLVATNYEKKEMPITVTLNRSKLGFKPEVRLEAVDAITGQPVAVEDGDVVRLVAGPELYRYVRIGPRSELDGPNLDLKHL